MFDLDEASTKQLDRRLAETQRRIMNIVMGRAELDKRLARLEEAEIAFIEELAKRGEY